MNKFEMNEEVRVVGEKPGSRNEYAVIRGIYENGTYWIANMNMPYQGTISDVVSVNKIEKV